MTARGWGIYVHVPWCRVRCPYCAFYVEPDRDADWPGWTGGILREYNARIGDFEVGARTLFIGGGTPSLLPVADLATLVANIALEPGAEVSIEANPEDVDRGWLDAAITAGANRLSLGIQTFNPNFARLLNRAHSVKQAREVAEMVAQTDLKSWSVDLIFGLPGQSLADLHVDIDHVLATGAPHVSLYGLTIEPGTPFERARDRGTLIPASDELWRAMYDALVERLEAAGLHRYEVSNFARPGHRSRHNASYWQGMPYMGLGPSAHGFLPDGRRYVNIRNATGYSQLARPTDTIERPTPTQAAADRIISGLRAVEGIVVDDLPVAIRPGTIDMLVQGGVLSRSGERIALTPAGFPIADAVVNRLVEALQGG